MKLAEIRQEIEDLKETQGCKRTFDFVATFVAEAGKADTVTIPINNAGDFEELGYNILYTENSKKITPAPTDDDPDAVIEENFCAVKLQFRSESANNSQSNDLIPVQLIATPGSDQNPRYGSRPFMFIYPKGDTLVIAYDNRAPQKLNDETYEIKNERIDIVFNGKLYITDVAR